MTGPNKIGIVVSATDDTGKAFDSIKSSGEKIQKALQEAGKHASVALADVGKQAHAAGGGVKAAGESARKAGADFDHLGEAGKKAGHDVKGALKDTASDAASSFSDRLGPLGGLLGKLGPAGLAAGAAIGVGLAAASAAAKGLEAALKASIERANIGSLIGAQGAATDPSKLAGLGKRAGQVYADGFGESLAQAGTALRDVIRNHLLPADATDDAVKRTTEKLLTVGTIVEADSASVARSVKQLIQTGMVQTADQAFDLITRGAQQGVDVAGDLLDTFDEYSTQFRKLGLDGQTALGLLSQGLKGGARDADIVADSLKEFAIRAVDGSKTTSDGFKRLGLDGKKMADDIAAGGSRAEGGLQKTLDRLRAIKDPAERSRVAVELFGTQAEDLGGALNALDPSHAVQALGKVQGAADDAGKSLQSGLGPQLDRIKRTFGQGLADAGDEIAPYAQKFIDTYSEFGDKLRDTFKGSTVPAEVKDSLRDIAEKYGPALRDALGEIADKVRENKPELEQLGHILANDVIPFLGGAFVDGVHLAGEAVGGMIDVTGSLVRTANEAKQGLEVAFADIKLAAAETFYGIAVVAAGAFSWVPGLSGKLDEARDRIKQFVDQANADLNRIQDQDVYIDIHTIGHAELHAARRAGGPTSTAATGGPRDGLTLVGEEGPELVRLPTGSMVYPHANTAQAMAGGGSGGGGTTTMRFAGDLDSGLATVIMQLIRGGQIQFETT